MSQFMKHIRPLSLHWHGSFIVAIVVLRLLVSYVRDTHPFIMHQFWPLSVFTVSKPFLLDVPILGALLLVYLVFERLLKHAKLGVAHVLTLLLMMVGTNLLQGYVSGIIQPIHGQGVRDYTYWSDMVIAKHMGLGQFVKQYIVLQPTLSYHGRVHPPGPTVVLYVTHMLLQYPILMSLGYALCSMATVLVIYAFLKQHVSVATSIFIAMLYGILPAFQIYGLASIDAIIASTSLLAIVSWYGSHRHRLWITTFATTITALLNFSAAWLILALLLISWRMQKKDTVSLLALLAGVYILIYLVSGYDYMKSFVVASQYEGTTAGWYGLADPASYLVTRVQGIIEPLVFLGPALSGLIVQSLRTSSPLTYIGKAGLVAFCAFLLAGAYYTGETARAALYVIPLLLIAVAPVVEKLSTKKRLLLARLVFGQAVLMQLFGYYSW